MPVLVEVMPTIVAMYHALKLCLRKCNKHGQTSIHTVPSSGHLLFMSIVQAP